MNLRGVDILEVSYSATHGLSFAHGQRSRVAHHKVLRVFKSNALNDYKVGLRYAPEMQLDLYLSS